MLKSLPISVVIYQFFFSSTDSEPGMILNLEIQRI